MLPAAATIKSANRRAPNCDTRARRKMAKRPRIGTGMAETTEKAGEKKLSVTPSKTLSLKGRGVEQGVVRQSFSHGRTKAVVVETVKSRTPTRTKPDLAAPAAAPAKQPAGGKAAAPAPAPAATSPAPATPSPRPSGVVLRTLTDEERTA